MPSPHSYLGIQALRALAAMLVVLLHASVLWCQQFAERRAEPWENGASGVDIFFVISGLVMTLSARGRGWGAARVFLWRRIARVVPLYWLFTTVKLLALTLSPIAGKPAWTGWWHIIASYLFIPAMHPRAGMYPVLFVGWTLNFEMFFYLLFAVALAGGFRLVRFLAPVLGAVAVAGLLRPDSWPDWTALLSPLVMEFLLGVALGQWVLRRRRLPGPGWSTVLVVAGLATLLLSPIPSASLRFLAWGLPAAAVVTGTVALEPWIGRALPRWLLSAGDASYSIYLTHTFVIQGLGIAIARLGLGPGPALPVAIVGSAMLSLAVGELVHRFVERPLIWALKPRRQPAEISGNLSR